MSPTLILFLQSLLIMLQMANAGLATIPHMPVAVPLFAAAVVGGFQFFVQNLGNLTQPAAKLETQVKSKEYIPETATAPAKTVETTTLKTEPAPPPVAP
jgi:hypothetical protein